MKPNPQTVIGRGKAMTFTDGLQLLFIGLKLTGHIGWSWWLVFMPFIVQSVCVVLAAVVEDNSARRQREQP